MRIWIDGLRVAAALVAALAATVASAQAPGGAGGAPPPPAVTVVPLVAADVTLTSLLPGRVVASRVAEVRPQVDGIITERMFEEGADVKEGDPLFRIDSATYEAQVASAKAQLASAEASFKAAEREEGRLLTLFRRNVVSEQNYDQALAARDAAAAAVEVAKAELNAADIGLQRTTIRAPISGVIGRSLTTVGALVTNGQVEPMAVIRDIDPVLVDVTQSAAEIIEWRKGLLAERLQGADETVTLTLADGTEYEETGQLTAAEPYVNEQTGVVTLRLEFPNPVRLLLPGMYVQVSMPQGIARNAVLVPQAAVSRDRRGRPTALVVNGENIVEERVLQVMEARGSDWVVRDGVADGDRVIVAGVQKVRPGAPVRPEVQGAEPAAGGGASAALTPVATGDVGGDAPSGRPTTEGVTSAAPAASSGTAAAATAEPTAAAAPAAAEEPAAAAAPTAAAAQPAAAAPEPQPTTAAEAQPAAAAEASAVSASAAAPASGGDPNAVAANEPAASTGSPRARSRSIQATQ
jgi:membrane fusion protein (multidrug efflux system)